MIINIETIRAARDRYIANSTDGRINIKAALIDMDGVLYDSMKNHTIAWHKLATELGIESNRNEFYLYEGMTGIATLNILYMRAFGKEITPDEAAELYKKKAQYFVEQGEPELIDGAMEMLLTLKNAGIERVLVTGSGQKSILDKLDHDYPKIFDTEKRVTAHHVTHGKPHPEPYIRGLEHAAVSSCEAIVIENAPLGVRAGKAAGCFTIGITTGPIPENEIADAGADLIFPSMADFALWLPKIIEILK